MKKNTQKKSKNSKAQSNGNLRLKVHTQINLSLDGVNVRKVDIALLPSNFEIVNEFAQKYQRYRVLGGKWRFYCLRNVNSVHTTAVPIYPIVVY